MMTFCQWIESQEIDDDYVADLVLQVLPYYKGSATKAQIFKSVFGGTKNSANEQRLEVSLSNLISKGVLEINVKRGKEYYERASEIHPLGHLSDDERRAYFMDKMGLRSQNTDDNFLAYERQLVAIADSYPHQQELKQAIIEKLTEYKRLHPSRGMPIPVLYRMLNLPTLNVAQFQGILIKMARENLLSLEPWTLSTSGIPEPLFVTPFGREKRYYVEIKD